MKIDLKEYFQNRDQHLQTKEVPGPVITISREYGCGGTIIARRLVQQLNDHDTVFSVPWKVISKEILYESAKELSLSPQDVQHVLQPHDKNLIEEMFSSLSTQFKPDEHKIHKTIRDIIMNYARQGHVVILGQGGVAITREIKRSLHIKLVAPLDWRVRQLSKKLEISEEEAKKRAVEYDHRRSLCIEHFMGAPTDLNLFDIILNSSSLTTGEIVGEIQHAAELKELAVH